MKYIASSHTQSCSSVHAHAKAWHVPVITSIISLDKSVCLLVATLTFGTHSYSVQEQWCLDNDLALRGPTRSIIQMQLLRACTNQIASWMSTEKKWTRTYLILVVQCLFIWICIVSKTKKDPYIKRNKVLLLQKTPILYLKEVGNKLS